MGVLPLYIFLTIPFLVFLFLPTIFILFLRINKKRQGNTLNKKVVIYGIIFQILWFIVILLYVLSALSGIGSMMTTMG